MDLPKILQTVREITETTVRAEPAAVNEADCWPEKNIRALLQAGLGGLVVSKQFNCLGQGLPTRAERSYHLSGTTLSQNSVLQHRIGVLWSKLESTRQLLYFATRQAESGDPAALLPTRSSKAAEGQCCVEVVHEAMTLMGGIGYGQHARMEVLLRDDRAVHGMAPTTEMSYTWLGRALLDQPMLDA